MQSLYYYLTNSNTYNFLSSIKIKFFLIHPAREYVFFLKNPIQI